MELPKFRLIRPDTSVFLYYAGRDRKYMALSRMEQKVFLDLPGLDVSEDTFKSEEALIQALRRADDVARYLRDRVNRNRPGPVSNYPTSVPYVENKVDRSFVAELGNAKAMFQDMAEGDLVIMTPPNHYDPLLIGEVRSAWDSTQFLNLPEVRDYTVPYREVTWLAHGLSRRDFPAEVARRMQNRKAITTIDPDYYEPIFKRVYHAYVWGNTSKLDVFAPLYNSNDPTATAEASFLIKYAIALYAAFEKNSLEEFSSLPIEVAAERFFDATVALQVAQAFGSPGGYLTKVVGVGAVAVAMILSVALSDESQPIDQVQKEVIAQSEKLAPKSDGPNLSALGNAVRAGTPDELRTKYGRKAKAKLGLTLHGQVSPEVSVQDRVVP